MNLNNFLGIFCGFLFDLFFGLLLDHTHLTFDLILFLFFFRRLDILVDRYLLFILDCQFELNIIFSMLGDAVQDCTVDKFISDLSDVQ